MFFYIGDWDDQQIDLNISLHVGFKIQFASIVPVILEFNGLIGLAVLGFKLVFSGLAGFNPKSYSIPF